VAVAPDGEQVAFFSGSNLVVGPFAKPQSVDLQPQQPVNRWQRNPAPVMDDVIPQGAPAWSADSAKVYFASEDGRLRCYSLANQNLEVLPWRGDWPTPVGANQLLFFRSAAAPKLDAPGAPAAADPVEIVVADLGAKALRSVRKTAPALSHPAASPDGKRLAGWSTTTPLNTWPQEHQLQVIDLADGKTARVGAVTTTLPGRIAWTADGTALVYQRDLDAPLPPDYLAGERRHFRFGDAGLFLCRLADGVETRLNRGSGCGLGALTADGGLLYFIAQAPTARTHGTMRLRRTTLPAVRAFAAATPELPVRTAAAWTLLIQQVCKAANVPADAGQARWTPALMAQLAKHFADLYPRHFKEAPPADPAGFDRQVRETDVLTLDAPTQRRLHLVLGAVRGEYLRTRHGAVWHLSETPGQRGPRADPAEESPFAAVVEFARLVNAFDDEDDEDDLPRAPLLEWTVHTAAGRTLLLTNDPARARAAVLKLADPALERGQALLAQGKSAEAEKVLTALLARPPHQTNDHLTLLVGRLLYEADRPAAAAQIMRPACDRAPTDPRKFNLLGLALLEDDPRGAIQAFKKALRCDQHFGPAWLNLAQAYRQAGDTPAAIACLRHYVEAAGYSPLGRDAARRLAALRE